jgi:hypothetical protein
LQIDRLDAGAAAGVEQMTGHPGREREQPIKIGANEISVTAFPQHAVMGRATIPARRGAMQRLACFAISTALAADDLVDHRDSPDPRIYRKIGASLARMSILLPPQVYRKLGRGERADDPLKGNDRWNGRRRPTV